MDALRYPLGRFDLSTTVPENDFAKYIEEIATTPARLEKAIQNLNEDRLNTPYRPEGWTVRQVVHHLPDSHINSYTRFRLALTEDRPTVRPYHEERWAELEDGKNAPVEVSLNLLKALHARWVLLLRSMTPEQYQRAFVHPEYGTIRLSTALAAYAWHGNHHIAHITSLRERMGW